MNKVAACVKRICPVKIPYKSSLNHLEHEHFVKAYLKYKTRKPKNSLEEQEYQFYMVSSIGNFLISFNAIFL